MEIIIVGGAAASGKSWVCKQLSPDKYSYVSYDETPKKSLLATIDAQDPSKPVVVDLHNGISTFIKNNKDKYEKITLLAIIEDEATIRARMEKRGGTFTVHTGRRMKRMETLSKKEYCVFKGTAEEVLRKLVDG